MTDIQTEFHRGGAYEGFEFAALVSVLGVDSDLAGERTVMHVDVAPVNQFVTESLRRHPRVHED